MNTEQKPFNTGCYSVRNLGETQDIIYQESTEIHLHNVDKGYLVLSKNDFGKVKKRINLGIFNKKTNFIVGEKNSLMFWDSENKELSAQDISTVLTEPGRYFMVYDMNFIGDFNNRKLRIQDKKTHEKIELLLNKQFGIDIGTFLRTTDPKNTIIPEEFSILRALINIKDSKLSINKQILVNSNPDFLLGILEGYLENSRHFQLKGHINIYNFTYILNLLGAQYSIRSVQDNEKHIRFKLPLFLKGSSTLAGIYFRDHKYFLDDEHGVVLKKNISSLIPNIEEPNFCDMVNAGFIELVPTKDLVFLELDEPQIMYDLTMPNAEATNYSLPAMPLAKNSDGDVLAVVALHTKDAAEEATRKFSTELKENFLNLSTGRVSNWGVKLDSALGLYTATK